MKIFARPNRCLALLALSLTLPLAQARMPFPLLDDYQRSNGSAYDSHVTVLKTDVLRVLDGDTIKVRALSNNVRIASIDAPETGSKNRPAQPFSQSAKSMLQRLLGPAPQHVELRCFEEDRYGRHICDVIAQNQNVGHEMVAQGMAWANTAASGRYLRSPHYVLLQQQAERERKGLWSEARKPVEPWVWRKRCWEMKACQLD